MDRLSTLIMLLLVLALLVGAAGALTGCEDEGPMEEAGEEVDDAVDEAGDAMEEAGDEAGDAMEEAGDEVEEGTDN